MTKRGANSAWSNRYTLPAVLKHQPRVDGATRYTVRLPNGASYTVCRPQSAEDAASWAPRPHYATATRGRQGSMNCEEGASL